MVNGWFLLTCSAHIKGFILSNIQRKQHVHVQLILTLLLDGSLIFETLLFHGHGSKCNRKKSVLILKKKTKKLVECVWRFNPVEPCLFVWFLSLICFGPWIPALVHVWQPQPFFFLNPPANSACECASANRDVNWMFTERTVFHR